MIATVNRSTFAKLATMKFKVEKMVCCTDSYVLCYAYIYSSKHIFRFCIILSWISSKRYSNLFWHILSLY